MRLLRLLLLWLGSLPWLGACSEAPSSGAAANRAFPDVLVICADDLTSQAVGAFGGRYADWTPHIDRLAAGGAVFRNATVSSPFCTPSRQSFLTGRWPHEIGVTQLHSSLSRDVPTIATTLRAAGYDTAAFGKMHWPGEQPRSEAYGFRVLADRDPWAEQLSEAEREVWEERRAMWGAREDSRTERYNLEGRALDLPDERQHAAWIVDRTISFLERDRDQPALVFASFHEPHAPFTFPPSFAKRADARDIELPDHDRKALRTQVPGLFARFQAQARRYGRWTRPEMRAAVASYLRSVAWADAQVGRLLDFLERTGRDEHTLVVFWSDHGFFLGEHGLIGKASAFEEVVRAPLIVRGPGIPAGHRPEPVALIDVFPTLCEWTGAELPSPLTGRSLLPGLRGEEPLERPTYCEFVGQFASVRDGRFKLVLGLAGAGLDQLYDLEADPEELTNLYPSPDHQPTRTRLTSLLHAEWKRTPPTWWTENKTEWMSQADPLEALRWALTRFEPEARARTGGQFEDED